MNDARTYNVKYQYTAYGTVTVLATSEEEAIESARYLIYCREHINDDKIEIRSVTACDKEVYGN